MDKIAKATARYSKGMDKAHCGICKHFEPPDACEIVAGEIAPSMWCEYFEKKRKKVRNV